MRRSMLMAMLTAMVLTAFSTSLLGQQTGSVVGTVADKTGAVIPGANVTLTNTASKDVRRTTTNAEGFFAFSGTVAGDYSVRVESQGFQAAEQAGIHLSPGDRRNLNVSMGVGSTAEHVTVEANASQVQVADSGDLSSTLNTKNIGNLSLQGRDVTELVRTLPGFNVDTSYNGYQNKTSYDTQIASIGSAVGRGFVGNGAPERAGGADLVSDGAHILDPGCACNATQTINPDMVQEVKVTKSSYGADSMTGPVVISAVSKSGSTEYHGGLYLHFRDAALNSWDYHTNQSRLEQIASTGSTTISKPQDRYWYPGGQFGGPVPFTNKKLVFFSSFEYYNQSFPEQTTSGIVEAQVPTLSMRQGLFDPTLADNKALCSVVTNWPMSADRCQPVTSIDTVNGYVGGITNSDISSYIGPGAKALLGLIPKPNNTPSSAATYNYVESLLNTNNGYMFHTRADYSFNDSTKLYVSVNQQHELYGSPIMRWWVAGDSIPYLGGDSSSNLSRTFSGNLVKVFNATTTNEFLASLGYLNVPNSIGNKALVDKKATNYPSQFPTASPILPSIANSWWSTDFGIPMLLDTGRAFAFERKLLPSVSDNLTKVYRTHTLKAGISWLKEGDRGNNIDQGTGPNGTVFYGIISDFNGPSDAGGKPTQINSSQDPVVDFMLDHAAGFSYAPATVSDSAGYSLGFYGQDEWKASKRLTLTFGLRVTHDTPWSDNTGKFGEPVFTDAWYKADVAAGVTFLPGMRWHAIDKSIPLSGRTANALFYAPRFGLAYDVFGKGQTMLRGGIGVYYYRDGLQGAPGANGPAGGSSCSLNQNSAFLSQLSSTTVPCAGTGGGVTSAGAVLPNDHTEPRTTTYNFTISQQTIKGSVLEVSYAGSQTADLINPLQDVNIIPIGAFMNPDPNPLDAANYGKSFDISTINTSDTLKQDYKPYTQYQKLSLYRHSAWANYNALQVSWSKQRGAFNYNLNYTFSKTMGIGKTPDPVNIHNDYGILSQDRTHVLNASYSYDLGRLMHGGRDCEDLVHCGPFLGGLLNGWMISGITSLQTGAPLQQSSSANFNFNGTNTLTNPDPTNSNNKLNTINTVYYLGNADGKNGTAYTLMPRLTCNPANTNGFSGAQYINPGCFSLPADPQFDSAGHLIALGGQGQYQWPDLRGPAYFTSDVSLSRTITITERQNVQIKFTGINFLNHALKSFDQNNANNINLNFNTGALVKVDPKNTIPQWYYGVPNERFGRRVLEMSLRYNF